MSLPEAIGSTLILVVATIAIIIAANTSTIENVVEVPEVEIVWQPRYVHNAINNPYIELTDTDEGIGPDATLRADAGAVDMSEVADN